MRSTHRICSALTIAVILAWTALPASAETVFFDDFSDGDAQDGMPVTWTENPSHTGYDATSGDYVLTPTTNNEGMSATVVDILHTNVSIRTQVRTSSVRGSAFVLARVQEPLVYPGSPGYFGGLEYRPDLGGSRLILGRADGLNDFTFFGDFPVLPFDVTTTDAVLQLDVIRDELELWVWKAGDPMPDQPQVVARDNTYSEGTMRIVNLAEDFNIATFRYVHVADSHISEPSGDFDDSGMVGNDDLTLLLDDWGGAPGAGWTNNPPATVGNDSLTLLLDDWGQPLQLGAVNVPEPSCLTIALLATMSGLSLRRRSWRCRS